MQQLPIVGWRAAKQFKVVDELHKYDRIRKAVEGRSEFASALPNLWKFVPNKNIITIKGKTFKRNDVLGFKRFFDEIDEGKTGKMTIHDYIKSVQTQAHLKRIAVSLFNYLDKDKKGAVTFEEMLRWIIPAATDDDIRRMLSWI